MFAKQVQKNIRKEKLRQKIKQDRYRPNVDLKPGDEVLHWVWM